VNKKGQFLFKLAITLSLAFALGIVPPLLLAHIPGDQGQIFWFAAGWITVLTSIAFYASSMSRGLLQAIPIGLALPTVSVMCIAILIRITAQDFPFTNSNLFPLIIFATVALTALWLAYRNYLSVQVGWPLWLRNIGSMTAAAGCSTLVAMMIFDR